MNIIYILILFITITDAKILDLHIGDRVEEVIYSNGKSYINKIQKNKEDIYTPNKSILELKIIPKELKTKYGYIYIYDLSKNGALLNATPFSTITINTNTNDIKLAIADNYYAQKEDNIPLKSKIIDLRKVAKKINLMQLKYIIAISNYKLSKSPIDSIVFLKSSYSNMQYKNSLSTWAWNPKSIEFNKIKDLNITRVYLQVKDGFKKALKEAPEDIEIFGLNGSPSDIYGYNHLIEDINNISKIPNVKGYQIDVEPYLLKEYNQNRDKIWQKYLVMIKKLKRECHRVGLKFSVVMPFWLDSITTQGKSVAFEVVNIADEVVLMSYRSNPKEIRNISKNILNYAQIIGKRVRIGLELMPIEDEKHIIYEVQSIKSCILSNKISNQCKILEKIRSFIVKGDSISFFKNRDKLFNFIKKPLKYNSFDGFVLHYYGVLK